MQLVQFSMPSRTKEYPMLLVHLYLSALGLLCHNKVAVTWGNLYFLVYCCVLPVLVSDNSFNPRHIVKSNV